MENKTTHQCFVCNKDTVIWDTNYSSKDLENPGGGAIQAYHCMNCGAEYVLTIPEEETPGT